MSTTRSFVAIELADEVRDVLTDVRASILDEDPTWRGEKWVAPENLHLTLKFLGNLEEAPLARMRSEIGLALADAEPCAISFADLKAVPSARRSSMIWARFSDLDGGCARLAERVEQATIAAGAEPARRPFALHVTLVRARRPRHLDPTALTHASTKAACRSGLMSVPRATLFASTLTRTGPIYETIESWQL